MVIFMRMENTYIPCSTRYNIDNLIRKQCYHYCYRWNGSHIYEKIIGTEWLNPQGDNVSDLTAKTIFLR